MVITAHPKDGLEIAKKNGLPGVICDFIMQHHGEGIAKYFYNQAVQEKKVLKMLKKNNPAIQDQNLIQKKRRF